MAPFRDSRVIPPDEVNMLDRLFNDELEARKLTRDCGEASDIAEKLIELYEQGIRDAATLRALIALL